MGLFDWLFGKKKEPEPLDPVAAFDQRIDALSGRAAALRKSAATLLTVRRDLDRKLEEVNRNTTAAKEQESRARTAGDAEAARVLLEDQQRFEQSHRHLQEQREKVITDAQALTEAVKGMEQEIEGLRRERDSARVRMAAKEVLHTTRPVLEDRIDELIKLDAARDEVERAHALAEIYREEAQARREKERA